MIYGSHLVTDWKDCMGSVKASAVSGSMISGVFVFDGKIAMPSKWRLPIIINVFGKKEGV